jgi:hypothetical protein
LLEYVSVLPIITDYTFMGHTHQVTPIKLLIGSLLAIFALLDLFPLLGKLQISNRYLPLGGVLSGFFGGLSGNQGALRSAFLIRAGLGKEQFIATGSAIACVVDITRLTVYFSTSNMSAVAGSSLLIFATTSAAFAGTYFGSRLITKVTIGFVQKTVAIAILILSFGIASGLL